MSDNVEEIKNKYEDTIYKQWESNRGWEHFKCSIADMLNELSTYYEQQLSEKQSRIDRAVEYIDNILLNDNETEESNIFGLKKILTEGDK
jgi:intein/homing endonuclease